MKTFLAELLLISMPASLAAQITVPATTPPYEPIVAKVEFPAQGDSKAIWYFDKACKGIKVDPQTVHIWGPPGKYPLRAMVITISWETKSWDVVEWEAIHEIGGATVVPTPPPGPGPVPPNPTPPPMPVGKLTAVIVHETEDSTTAFSRMATALRNPNGAPAMWMKSKGHKLLILDEESVDVDGRPTEIVVKALAAGIKVPFLSVLDSNNHVLATKSIDGDESDGTATSADNIVEWMRQAGG